MNQDVDPISSVEAMARSLIKEILYHSWALEVYHIYKKP